MKKWWLDLSKYLYAIIAGTGTRLTSGIVVGIVSVCLALTSVPHWCIWTLVGLAIFAASFDAWRDELNMRELAQNRLIEISRTNELEDRIALLCRQGKDLETKLGPHDPAQSKLSPKSVPFSQRVAIALWIEDVKSYLKTNLGEKASFDFENSGWKSMTSNPDEHFYESSKLTRHVVGLTNILKNMHSYTRRVN